VFKRLAEVLAEDHTQIGCWSVPYCWECKDHVEGITDRGKRGCATLDEAVSYEGTEACVHTFRFWNYRYANEFLQANSEKCVGVETS
jgi:hypothetical protein